MKVTLSPDTQATLLLVGRFARASEMKPLTTSEYNQLAKQLLDLNLRPSDMLQQMPKGLVINSERLTKLLERGASLALALERWSQLGIEILGRSDDRYPSKLKKKLRGLAPPILYCVGDLELLKSETVCVVGSRNASEAGLKFAEDFGKRCALEGLNVVSGDARGVDRTAMDSAIKAGGKVIAVLVDALTKVVLAKRNRDPIMSGNLVLISPYDPDSGFSVAKAMDRNKYMYALGSAAIVVDSDTRGGTWAGAIENQKHAWARAFVRLDNDVSLGNMRLVDMGLTPIKSFPKGCQINLKEFLLSDYENGSPQLELVPSKSQKSALNTPNLKKSLYSIFLAELEEWLLEGSQSDVAIAKHFGLEPVQVDTWLDKAKNKGVILEIQDSEKFVGQREFLRSRK